MLVHFGESDGPERLGHEVAWCFGNAKEKLFSMSGSGDAAAAAEVLNLVEPKQLTKKKVCLRTVVALDRSRMVNVSLCKVLPCAGGKNFSLCRDRAEHSESKFTSTFPYIDQYLNSLSRSHHRGRRTARH